MKIQLLSTLKKYKGLFKQDIFSGIIIAACLFPFPWDMHRLPGFLRFMACMVLFFLYYYSQFFLHQNNLFGVKIFSAALAGSAGPAFS